MTHLAYVFERFPSFTQTFCVREVTQLRRMGVKPLIFSIRDTRDEEIMHFPKELLDSVHFLPNRDQLQQQVRQWKDEHLLPRAAALVLRNWEDRPDKMRVYEAAYIAKIIADHSDGKPCHVHSHFAGLGARTCWWLRRFTGFSYSFTAHANDIFCKPGEQLPSISRLFDDAALVITVSDFTAKQLRFQYPDTAPRIHRVYNGLDLEPIIAARKGADRSGAGGGILSVGRLIEKKGFKDLITACGLLRDRAVPFHCRIVGEGPLEDELRQQIIRLGLRDQVELTGPLGMNEIVQLLAEKTEVFALACATEQDGGMDNLPTVLMEAMAASLPCVSTRLAGVPEMVLDGKTGLICEEGQPADFAAHLETLLKNPDLRSMMGEAGLAHARAAFSQEKTGQQLLERFAEFSGIRFDASLGVSGKFIRRLPRLLSRQLRHQSRKVSGKNFDLADFMSR